MGLPVALQREFAERFGISRTGKDVAAELAKALDWTSSNKLVKLIESTAATPTAGKYSFAHGLTTADKILAVAIRTGFGLTCMWIDAYAINGANIEIDASKPTGVADVTPIDATGSVSFSVLVVGDK